MNVIKSRFVYHLMAIITVAIWGTTFVSTKIPNPTWIKSFRHLLLSFHYGLSLHVVYFL